MTLKEGKLAFLNAATYTCDEVLQLASRLTEKQLIRLHRREASIVEKIWKQYTSTYLARVPICIESPNYFYKAVSRHMYGTRWKCSEIRSRV